MLENVSKVYPSLMIRNVTMMNELKNYSHNEMLLQNLTVIVVQLGKGYCYYKTA